MENTAFRSSATSQSHWNASCQGMSDGGIRAARNTILIADASAPRRRALAQILNGLALDIIEAESVREAVLSVSLHRIDLMLIDFGLDDGGAVELCRRLKQARATQFLPVFVTAHSDDIQSEVQSMEAGADGFFTAPLRPQAFRARVQAILRHKASLDARDHPETVLLSLAQSVEGRDPGLGQHCERLALMVSAMGLALGLPEQDILTLQRAAYLHDIGKVSIPDSILFKAGPLTPEEWEVMKSHPERGERICSNLRSLAPVLPVVRHHHEKWNGSGYPDSLAGEEIPLLARILQLADIYDALTNSRCYKRAFTSEEAMEIIREEAQKGWRDPVLTEQFAALIPFFSDPEKHHLSGLSLHALARSLQGTDQQFREELPEAPGFYDVPVSLVSQQ
jgi:putative two-component system response regulator